MTLPTPPLGCVIVSSNFEEESLGKRHLLKRLPIPEIRPLSSRPQKSTTTSDISPKNKSCRQISHLDSLSAVSSEDSTLANNNQKRKRRHSSFNSLRTATKKTLQKIRNLFTHQKPIEVEEVVIFSEKYTLDLPEHISRDKSELDYLRRTNAEEAAAALAIKNAKKAHATAVEQPPVIITVVSQGYETQNITPVEDVGITPSKQQTEDAKIVSSKQQIGNNTKKISFSIPSKDGDDESESTTVPAAETIDDKVDTKDDTRDYTESWESKLARNPFYPFRDFRLDMVNKIDASSDLDTTLRDAVPA